MGFYSGRKILVTGGNGFIGTNLIAALLQSKANLRSVGIRSRPDALSWSERTRAMFGGMYPGYSFGELTDRCFGVLLRQV